MCSLSSFLVFLLFFLRLPQCLPLSTSCQPATSSSSSPLHKTFKTVDESVYPNEVTAGGNCPLKGRKLRRRENRRKSPGRETLQRQGESPKKRTEKGNERTENTKKGRRDPPVQARRGGNQRQSENIKKTHRIVQRIDRGHESDDGVHQLSHEEQATGASKRAKRSSAATGPMSQPIFSASNPLSSFLGVPSFFDKGLDFVIFLFSLVPHAVLRPQHVSFDLRRHCTGCCAIRCCCVK